MTAVVADAQASSTASGAGIPGRRFILGAWQDLCLIHGCAGLVVLPVALAAYLAPSLWTGLFLAYSFLLGLPHIAATHARLAFDDDCRDRRWMMALLLPLGIAALLLVAVFRFHAAPYVVLVWFLAQTWHANRQNYGIMRRYARMALSNPAQAVNHAAALTTDLIPWAAVLTAATNPSTRYLGYEIAFPGAPLLGTLASFLWLGAAAALVSYLVLEARELAARRFVPGRILCVWTGCLVNITAWLVVREISWAYLVVSTWHALQYIAYTQAFRASPPPGARVMAMGTARYMALIFAGGTAMNLAFRGLAAWLPPLVIIVHLTLNFHHYLCDTIIWRARRQPG